MPSIFYASYAGGVNAAAATHRLMQETQVRMLANGTVRTGNISPRPAFRWQGLKWLDTRAQALWQTGICQGMEFYNSPDGEALVFVFDGHVLFLHLPTMEVRHVYVEGTDRTIPPFNKFRPFVYLRQRGRYMVVQDGTGRPLILDGMKPFFQPLKSGKMMTGTLMAEGWGRLALASHDRTRIYFSDHELSQGGPLSFTEGTSYFLNARYFQVPLALGRVVALEFSPSLNGTKRFGPLLAFCERGTMAYDVSRPRDTWLTNDPSAMILPHLGACSHRCVTARGANVIFSDHFGRVQSLSGAVAESQDNTLEPIDSPVWPLFRDESPGDRRFRSAVTFDDRTLTTVLPERRKRVDGRLQVRHRAISALQHDPALPLAPVWDGIWTGIHPVTMTTAQVGGASRCFVLSLDNDGMHRLYEIGTAPGNDVLESEVRRVPVLVSLRPTDLDSPFAPKSFQGAAMRLSGIRGQVKVRAWWQQDRAAPRHWFNHSISGPDCMTFGCQLTEAVPSSIIRIGLPDPGGDFFEGAMTFEITGLATLEEVGLDAKEPKTVSKTPDTSCSSEDDKCGPNPFSHSI